MQSRAEIEAGGRQILPIHPHEAPLVMQLAVHLLPSCGNNLSVAWAQACARYWGGIKNACAQAGGIPIPAGVGIERGEASVHCDDTGFFVSVKFPG